MPRTLQAVCIVIPAHNEEARIGGCLAALRTAMDRFAHSHPQVRVLAVIVADYCTDQTAAIVAQQRDPRLSLHTAQLGNVGAARAAGTSAALRQLPPGISDEHIWIACTDADTRVPEHWLEGFAALHAAGADAVAGTVEPDAGELDARIHALWQAAYEPVDGHRHIHGANFGVSAAAYKAVGGFPALAAREDVALAQRLRGAGYALCASAALKAITSGRLRGRLREGFADYLAALAGEEARAC